MISCQKEIDQDDVIRIVSPVSGWTYYEDNKIHFTTNVDTENINWYSAKDGFLGNKNGLNVFLSEGEHEIFCLINGYRKKVQIFVKKRNYRYGESIVNLLNESNKEVKLKAGNYYPYLISCEGKGKEIQKIQESNCDINGSELFRINTNIKSKKRIMINDSRSNKVRKYIEGEKKNFYIIKTDDQNNVPHEIEFEMIKSSQNCTVWIPVEREFGIEKIQEVTKRFETIIFPRITKIWGNWADIDEDGKIAFVFSPTINQEKQAIGFFNPSDLFKNEDNNYSNEMDIVYFAIPDDKESSYSLDSITATMAHEITHAITFNSKTYKRILNGEQNVLQEEIFIDEGLSHLSENLCGYGISGGNVDFIRYYLENTLDYSFCKENAFGQNDSAGQRGAMCLFLSWLFWKKGGMSWDNYNPIEIKDCGGIKFLKELINSKDTGWENIGKIYGLPIEELFTEFVEEINLCRIESGKIKYQKDPVTEEYVEFFCNMPEISLQLPKVYNESEIREVLPWSMVLFDNIKIDNQSVFLLKNYGYIGNIFYNFIYSY